MDLYADGGSKIVGVLPGFQHERISLACELFRKALGKSGVALAGAQPAGDVILVPFRQQAGGQDFPALALPKLADKNSVMGPFLGSFRSAASK